MEFKIKPGEETGEGGGRGGTVKRSHPNTATTSNRLAWPHRHTQ